MLSRQHTLRAVRFLMFLAEIFLARCNSAADMSLGFVLFEYPLRLFMQRGIYFKKTFVNILMYRGFADIKNLRRAADGRVVLGNVLCQLYGAFFYIILHSPTDLSMLNIYVKEGGIMI